MPHPRETVERASRNFAVHELAVANGSHAVVFAPEDIRRHIDCGKDRAQVFRGNADQGLLHDERSIFVIMHAHKLVEEFLPQRLECFHARYGQEQFAALRED